MTEHASDDLFIGRQADGTKVFVKARFDHTGSKVWRTDVNHQPTTERLRLSIQGMTVSKYGSIDRPGSWIGAGQNRHELDLLTTLAPGWTVGDVVKLGTIWDEWHLNDMQAGCAHQPKGTFPNVPNCPETGYRHGSAWLFKPLPFDVFSWVSDVFGIEPPAPGVQTI